jgi:uncharacterized protein
VKIILRIFFIALLISVVACRHYNKSTAERTFINYEAIKKYPKPTSYVSDFEGLLTLQEKQQLESMIYEFEKKTTNQIAIVTISDVKPYESLTDFTTDLANYWGVGQADKDNGLVITVSKNIKNVRIGTGLGTEKILTDKILKEIIDLEMIPYFKKGEYFEGIKTGLIECMRKWE